jgi:hypothetical protein
LSFTLSWQTPAPQATSKFTNVINQLGKKEDPFLPKPNGPPCNLVIPKRSKGIAWKNNTSSCSIEENENENDQRSNTSVYFHYLYHSMLRRMTEKRPDYSCPWCNLFCGTIRGLLAHLTCSHSYFRFQVTVSACSLSIFFFFLSQY